MSLCSFALQLCHVSWQRFLLVTFRLAGFGFLVVVLSGCAVRPGRDYGHVLFRPAPFFQVQVLERGGLLGGQEILVRDVLLLPPIGTAPLDVVRDFPLMMWQELQQAIPGCVRVPRQDGAYVDYSRFENMVSENGVVQIDELARIGELAGSSHVLLPRIVSCRPYHPQQITMEWMLVRVEDAVVVLVLVGSLDASEQQVLMAADSYLRDRKASPYDTNTLNMLLRSPRSFTGFAMAEAVDALRPRLSGVPVIPEFKSSTAMTDIPVRE